MAIVQRAHGGDKADAMGGGLVSGKSMFELAGSGQEFHGDRVRGEG